MLRIFFLVCSQLAVGGLALMHLVPAEEIGKGFFRTCASIYLLIWVLVVAGLDWDRPWEFLMFVLFTLLFLAYYASLWIEKLPSSKRLLELTAIVGLGAIGASALGYSANGYFTDEALFRIPNFLLSTIAMGAAMTGMLLGHWYLVTPELSLVPIKRLTGILVGVLMAQGILLVFTVWPDIGAVPDSLVPRVQHLLLGYPYFLLGRALVGLVGTCGLAVLTMWLLQEASTQAATGFLYTAVLTITVGELIARFLFQLTGVPV